MDVRNIRTKQILEWIALVASGENQIKDIYEKKKKIKDIYETMYWFKNSCTVMIIDNTLETEITVQS
jgi:hypothetical protein